MNLEELITQAYTKHQAKIQAEQEEKQRVEREQIESAISQLRTKLDKAIPRELQEALGIEFDQIPAAFFKYRYVGFSIRLDHDDQWWVVDSEQEDDYVQIKSDNLIDYLLLRLGEIREKSSLIDKKKVEEIQSVLNIYCVEVEKIFQSEVWRRLCDRANADPEMKTHLGDVLHYLSEAMGCIDEA